MTGGEEDYFDADEDSEKDEYESDDSDEDPSYDALNDSKTLPKLASKKIKSEVEKLKLSSVDEETESFEVELPDLTEKDAKCFEKVEEIIRAGKLASLKVEECKVYLRKFGLRLSGKKGVLIERIKEHLEIMDGAGEKRYPVSSFLLNCKGDACTGDTVMFEQNVYETYSVVSRSATGPPCGTRTVAGRIVKESYGAAKQQHTFTIEVLWSKGEKPLPPLCPLLIKGRNLYRLKTMRQRWADEEERRKALLEKHTRGSQARLSRETRIQKKEMRKKLGTRTKNKEERISISEERSQRRQRDSIQCEGIQKDDLSAQPWDPTRWPGNNQQKDQIRTHGSKKKSSQREVLPNILAGSRKQQNAFPSSIQKQHTTIQSGSYVPFQQKVLPKQQNSLPFKENLHPNIQPQHTAIQGGTYASLQQRTFVAGGHNSQVRDDTYASLQQRTFVAGGHNSQVRDGLLQRPRQQNGILPPDYGQENLQRKQIVFLHRRAPVNCSQQSHREQLEIVNHNDWATRPLRRQVCPFYPLGRCWYGDTCKYVHE